MCVVCCFRFVAGQSYRMGWVSKSLENETKFKDKNHNLLWKCIRGCTKNSTKEIELQYCGCCVLYRIAFAHSMLFSR